MILNKKQIKERLNNNPPMVTNLKDINVQLQPTSLDLTVKNIYTWASSGCLDFDNSKRKLSEKDLIKPDSDGRYYLPAGNYQIEVNELFNMPLDVVGKTISKFITEMWCSHIGRIFRPRIQRDRGKFTGCFQSVWADCISGRQNMSNRIRIN